MFDKDTPKQRLRCLPFWISSPQRIPPLLLLLHKAVIVSRAHMSASSSPSVRPKPVAPSNQGLNFMHHSKYNPEYDPKHSSNRPETAALVRPVPAALTPAVDIQPVQASAAPQIATRSDDPVVTGPNRQDGKADSQDAPVTIAVEAAASSKDMDAPIGDNRQPAADKNVHAEREPSALTGGLPELPVTKANPETRENTPDLSGKTSA
ncbi:MAG: hypothetical protein KGQ68_08225 [Gammaproteobacteria bacterium]|nr:hypothetical protein [Gammaproteobacteria bacterium]